MLVVRNTVLNVCRGTGTGVFVIAGAVTVLAFAFALTLAVAGVVLVAPWYGVGVDEVVVMVYVAIVYEIPCRRGSRRPCNPRLEFRSSISVSVVIQIGQRV